MTLVSNAKRWARAIKRDVHAVWLAARDPRTPRFAKALALVVAAYAVSPIDLIPDFVPVLGYPDDLVIVPLGILLVVRLIPPEVMEDTEKQRSKPPNGQLVVWRLALSSASGSLVLRAWSGCSCETQICRQMAAGDTLLLRLRVALTA